MDWEALLSDVPERSVDLLNSIHLTQGKPSKALYVVECSGVICPL